MSGSHLKQALPTIVAATSVRAYRLPNRCSRNGQHHHKRGEHTPLKSANIVRRRERFVVIHQPPTHPSSMGRTFVYDWLAGTSAKRQSASGLITEQDYQNMQRKHKRRRMLESNAADLNTSGITMNDVMMRTYGHASKPEKKKCE